MGYGYVLSHLRFQTIVFHDRDILIYSRDMLARLCYPVTSWGLEYDFCKGFLQQDYRPTTCEGNQASRNTPYQIIAEDSRISSYTCFFDSFRYPLAGEFSMDVDMAIIIRIPWHRGLEAGMLAEIYRNTSSRRVYQVDITENYERKHQELSPEDASKGLHKMCVDICKSLFRTLASEGIVFSDVFFKTLVATYTRTAQDMLKRYEDELPCI